MDGEADYIPVRDDMPHYPSVSRQGRLHRSGRIIGPILQAEEEHSKMDGETDYMPLHDELVERIFAMVPFPYIFKVRVLSKSWLARFSPISSHDKDEEKKQLAISFQKRVSECSIKWKTFSPAFVGKLNLIAYDYDSQNWLRTPTFFFPCENREGKSSNTILQVEGAVVLIRSTSVCSQHCDLYVANILTHNWKQLPPHPEINVQHFAGVTLVSHMGMYKVICLWETAKYCIVEVFDSQLGAWRTSKYLKEPRGLGVLRKWGEYLNGRLYWLVRLNQMAKGLLAFNVHEEIFESLEMPPVDTLIEWDLVDLVVCNGSLLLIIYNENEVGDLDKVILLKIELGLRRWVKVTEGPPHPLNSGNFLKVPASDGNSLFFAGEDFDKILTYNVQKDKWSDLSIPPSFEFDEDSPSELPWSFRPGLNPFMAL